MIDFETWWTSQPSYRDSDKEASRIAYNAVIKQAYKQPNRETQMNIDAETCRQEAERRLIFVFEHFAPNDNKELRASDLILSTACESMRLATSHLTIDNIRHGNFWNAIVVPYGRDEFIEAFAQLNNPNIYLYNDRFDKVDNYINNNSKEGKVVGQFKWMVVDHVLVDGCEVLGDNRFVNIDADSLYYLDLLGKIQETVVDGWLPSSTVSFTTDMVEVEHKGKKIIEHSVTSMTPFHKTQLRGFDSYNIVREVVQDFEHRIRFDRRQNMPKMELFLLSSSYEFTVLQPSDVTLVFDTLFEQPSFELFEDNVLTIFPSVSIDAREVEGKEVTTLLIYGLNRGNYKIRVKSIDNTVESKEELL